MISPKLQLQVAALDDESVKAMVGLSIVVGCGDAPKAATGFANTFTYAGMVMDAVQPLEVTMSNETVYAPALAKQWLGFCEFEIAELSPKSHDQELMIPGAIMVDMSLKLTQRGAQPERTSPASIATGTGLTVTSTVVLSEQPFASTTYAV